VTDNAGQQDPGQRELNESVNEDAHPNPVGVGPHDLPWPIGEHFDPELLAEGDRRNVIDRYRYWKMQAIRDDLDGRRFTVHLAVENWEHDFNIGTVVRNANALGSGGSYRWATKMEPTWRHDDGSLSACVLPPEH